MRELPHDIDADVIFEISRLLDGHSKVSPVSIMWLIDEIRQNFETALSDDALELLAVEMVSTRHLPIKLDQPPKKRRQQPTSKSD
jgi:hypothetical protein